MPRPHPPEFRARAIALVRSGKQVRQTAYGPGISAGRLHGTRRWIRIRTDDINTDHQLWLTPRCVITGPVVLASLCGGTGAVSWTGNRT